MMRLRGLLCVAAVVFAVTLGWLYVRQPQPNLVAIPAPANRSMATGAASATPAPPPRVIEQRPPAARDDAAVIVAYGFVGAVGDEAGGTLYLFTRADQSYAVALGGILDGTWRVESVESDRVRLTRLSDGVAGVIPYASAGSGSLELPRDAVDRMPAPQASGRRALHGRHH